MELSQNVQKCEMVSYRLLSYPRGTTIYCFWPLMK